MCAISVKLVQILSPIQEVQRRGTREMLSYLTEPGGGPEAFCGPRPIMRLCAWASCIIPVATTNSHGILIAKRPPVALPNLALRQSTRRDPTDAKSHAAFITKYSLKPDRMLHARCTLRLGDRCPTQLRKVINEEPSSKRLSSFFGITSTLDTGTQVAEGTANLRRQDPATCSNMRGFHRNSPFLGSQHSCLSD
jgi:hypothetical protein